MRSAWMVVCFSMVAMMAMAGCGDDGGDSGAGSGGNSCVDDGVARGSSEACAACGCDKCATQINNCQDPECESVLACGIRTGCKGTECYCGVGVTTADCLNVGASGPCMNEIVAASGVMVGVTAGCSAVNTCAVALASVRTEPANPLYRSNAVSECTKGADAVVDGNGNVTTPAIIGMCMTECL